MNSINHMERVSQVYYLQKLT